MITNLEEHINGIIADIRDNDYSLVVATLIADKLQIPLWYLREQKQHGKGKEIEGNLKELYRLLKEGKKIYLKDFGKNYLKLVVSEELKDKVVITLHWLAKRRVKKIK